MHCWGNTILLCALVSSVSKRDADDVTITLNLQACYSHKLQDTCSASYQYHRDGTCMLNVAIIDLIIPLMRWNSIHAFVVHI